MGLIQALANQIMNSLQNQEISTSAVLAVLAVAGILAVYEFIVYQAVLHRSQIGRAHV